MAIKIGLDAGHSEESRGTYTVEGKDLQPYEDTYTLELCKFIAEYLEANGIEVFLTRKDEKAVGDSSDRAKACVKAGCDFALSIHFNGFNTTSANGTEIYAPFAEKYANIEVGLYNYLTQYFKAREPFARSSGTKGHAVVLDKKMNLETKRFEAISSEKDYFGFIRTAWENGLSADLLEVCFLTNRKDFDTYKKDKKAIASDIARAIVEGFDKTYKPTEETVVVLPVKPKKPKRVGAGRLNKNRDDLKL